MLNKVLKVRFDQSNRNSKKWELGWYWGEDNIFFINDNDSKEIQKLFKLIIETEKLVVKTGDKIYATKASEIPRFKLKEFIKEKKLKKTSRYNQADCIIINRGYFHQLIKELKYKEHYFLTNDTVLSNYRNWLGRRNEQDRIVNELVKKDKDLNHIAILDDYSINEVHRLSATDKSKFDYDTHVVKGTFVSLYRQNKLKELLQVLYNLKKEIINGDVRVIFDEEMFVELNKEGIELDDDYLQVLRDMLFSKDKSNVKLGFEMMSNLVVNDHTILSISFLLNELYHTTNFRPSYYTNTNTNLKSLLKLLQTKRIFWERDWKTFGTGLRQNFKDGKEGAVVKRFLLDNINREFKLSNSAAESLVDIVFTTEVK